MDSYSVHLNEMGMASVIFVAATYTQVLNKELLYEALGKLVDEEPMLRCNVFGEETTSRFFGRVDVDLDKVVFYRPDISSCQELSDLLIPKERYKYGDEHMPLWKVYVIGKEGVELAWVYDHSISDGASGVFFHQKLLSKLNKETSEKKVNEIKMAPSVENAIDVRPSWGFSFQVFYSMLKKKLFGASGAKTWIGKPPAVPMESQTELFDFEPEYAAQLLDYCRKRNITLTALLYAALLQTLRSIIPEEDQMAYDDLGFSCPVNARRYIPRFSTELGNYVFQFTHKAPIKDNRTIEEEAKEILPVLKEATTDPTEIKYVVGLLNYINIPNRIQEGYKAQSRSGAMEISNLGSYDFSPKGGKIGLSKLVFSQGVNSLTYYTTVSLVGIKNGPISVSISVARDDENHSICKTLRRQLFKRLDMLLHSE